MSANQFRMLVTTLGRAKLASAIANKTPLNLSRIAVGDGAGNPVEPNENAAGLVNEVYSAGINMLGTDPKNPAYAVLEFVIPTDAGGWNVREIGVYDNADNLIAIGNYPEVYKPLADEGSTRELVIRIILEVGSSGAVQLMVDGSIVMASRAYVDEKANLSNLIPGGLAGMVLTKKSNQDGNVEWVDLGNGITVLVDAKEERKTLTAGQVTVTLNTIQTGGVGTVGTAFYIDGKRIPRGAGVEIIDDTTIKLTPPATAGQVLLAVRNNPADALNFLGKQSNLADVPDKTKARTNLGLSADDIVKIVVDKIYPVGHILHTTKAGNPGTYLAGTNWKEVAVGRMLVGRNPNDSNFSAIGTLKGTNVITLSESNMPAHTHGITGLKIGASSAGGHKHTTSGARITTSPTGAHTHQLQAPMYNEDGIVNDHIGSGGPKSENVAIDLRTTSAGDHQHTFDVPSGETNQIADHTHTVTISGSLANTGGGQSYKHIPECYVVYIWERTAN